MLREECFVDWVPLDGTDERPHPTKVCEPTNLAAARPLALVHKLRGDTSGLSTMQTETLRAMFDSFATRATFLLGDATGVGKGRTIAGAVRELRAVIPGARTLWVSANLRLGEDACFELSELGMPDALQDHTRFHSYASLLNMQTVIDIIAWLRAAPHSFLVLDECHLLRNATLTSQTIRGVQYQLQQQVPLWILYSSATAASAPRHLHYLSGLGLWGTGCPFVTYDAMCNALQRNGSSLMELLAIEMRSSGAYVARQLSFSDVRVTYECVELSAMSENLYDQCVVVLRDAKIIGGIAHQNFFQRLITALKTQRAIELTEQALERGESVIISIVSTCEAHVTKNVDSCGNHDESRMRFVGSGREYNDVYAQVETELDLVDLPPNALDQIVFHFGPNNIAELTGRHQRRLRPNGPLECKPNIVDEAREFRSSRKKIAVLSRAGGIGISLHDAEDGRPRTHIVLELPWSAEDLLQQMGRSHRSSSRHPPRYILLGSNIPAEMRFIGGILEKLRSLGALIKGDSYCCSTEMSRTPKWTTTTRRSLNLCLAFAKKYTTDMYLPTILTRAQALELCHSHDQTQIMLKNHLIDMLNGKKPAPCTMEVLLGVTKYLFPTDVAFVTHKWSSKHNITYPEQIRALAETVLLCHQAWESRNTLGILPIELVHTIIGMAVDIDIQVMKDVQLKCETHRLLDMSQQTMDFILNRMLGIELNAQRHLFWLADGLSVTPTPRKNNCLLQYAEDRAGGGIRARISDIQPRRYGVSSTGYCVCLEYSCVEPKEPSVDTKVWRHQKSGRVAWSDQHGLYFADGNQFLVEKCTDEDVRARGFLAASRDIWDDAIKKHRRLVHRRTTRLQSTFHIVCIGALHHWSRSHQRILRVPTESGYGIIGLLISDSMP